MTNGGSLESIDFSNLVERVKFFQSNALNVPLLANLPVAIVDLYTRLTQVAGELLDIIIRDIPSFPDVEQRQVIQASAMALGEFEQLRLSRTERDFLAGIGHAAVALQNLGTVLIGAHLDKFPADDVQARRLIADLTLIRSQLTDRVLSQATTAAVESAEAAGQAAASAKKSAGDSGTDTLYKHFKDYRKAEFLTGLLFQVLFVLVLVGAALFAARVAIDGADDGLSLRSEISHLLLTVPFFALAGYFAREAGTHNKAARHAKDIAVRLQTLEGYTEVVGATVASDIREAFGRELFSLSRLEADEGNVPGKEYADVLKSLSEALNSVLSKKG